jgi:hypothetical protein
VNSQHSGGRGRLISEFEANLVYRVSSRTAKATQRNPVLKNKKTKNKKQKNKTKQNKTKQKIPKKKKSQSNSRKHKIGDFCEFQDLSETSTECFNFKKIAIQHYFQF